MVCYLTLLEKALFRRGSNWCLESGAAGQIWTVDLAITNGVLYPWATAAFLLSQKLNIGQLHGTMPHELLSNQEGLL